MLKLRKKNYFSFLAAHRQEMTWNKTAGLGFTHILKIGLSLKRNKDSLIIHFQGYYKKGDL